jgi:hypothetical protein
MCYDNNSILIFYKISSSIFEVEIGSNADVGSSINKIEGLIARARAIHNRCC